MDEIACQGKAWGVRAVGRGSESVEEQRGQRRTILGSSFKGRETVSTQLFDPAQYKAGQGREWSTAAPAWKNWWQRIEPALQPISDRMMDLAGIRPGQQVLDVATGIGAPAVAAARRVGPTGGVIATDIAPQMLAIGRERVLELGLDNINFLEMDAKALELPESSFDAILCRFGLMFLPNLQTALGQMRELLVPGGQLTAAVWGPPQTLPFASIPLAVAPRERPVA